ncbi:MAG: methionyl-tRNA formyltransferase [Candidatus Omnitrophica bacterium]|nr:methionyl-tRNA formyltransferase [Candidatus Omnitrophota bacterium]
MRNVKLRIVFFASGKIAVPTLKFLVKNKYNVVCVVTATDAKKGRHLLSSETPIKEAASKYGLDIFQPRDLFSNDSLEYIRRLKPHIFVVFCFGRILSNAMLNIPRKFALNIHASLLPKYRGAAPINWALINGDNKTGVTVIKMNEKMDKGDIFFKKEIDIDLLDNAITLEDKIAEMSPEVLKEALTMIESDKLWFIKQNEKEASLAPKLKKEDGKINWEKSAENIINQIRGCLPWPGTHAFYKNKLVKIWDAEISAQELDKKHPPGAIVDFNKKGILVAARGGFLLIKELQLANGKRLSAWDFIQGHQLKKDEKFE